MPDGKPDTSYEFVHAWMQKAETSARQQGRSEAALLWADALQHLEYFAKRDPSTRTNFQAEVRHWTVSCFGEKIANDRIERNHRFLEEALELVQACGCTATEAHALVDYVFGRPVGELKQELGGVLVTLAALCNAYEGLDFEESAREELRRCWKAIEKIRAKQAAKPKHSPLPQFVRPDLHRKGKCGNS